MKISGFVFFVFLLLVLVTGTTAAGLFATDAFADGQGKGNDNGKGKEGHGKCEKATEASQGKTKNPHCDTEPPITDTDSDGIPDVEDNCPNVSNVNQEDLDGDGIGDVCDDDRDGDGILNGVDACPDAKPLVAGPPVDHDGDTIPDDTDRNTVCPNS